MPVGLQIQSSVKWLARRVVPDSWRARVRAFFGWQWFKGSYRTWDEASGVATGYSSPEIVARVLQSTREVIAGRAAYERDGVLFLEPEEDRPLAAALSYAREASQGRLRVLDFGGGLGSSFWRHRAWLESIGGLRWDVVEQPGFVEAGRDALGGSRIRFFTSVEEACSVQDYDVVLASGVIQYLPDPDTVINAWMRRRFPMLLFNNLPLHDRADRIAVQYVPPSIYSASYPVRFFDRERFLRRFDGQYILERQFESEAVWPMRWREFPSTGLLLRCIT